MIDVGGRDTASLRAALTVADTLLIPFQPRTFDVWAIDHMAALIEEAETINENLNAFSVLNAADSGGQGQRRSSNLSTTMYPNPLSDSPIVRRKVYPNAAAQGKGIIEYLPRDQKAVDELARLISFVYQK